jgi:acetyltransferase-like isoleucine patch superfamily enzyme
MMCRLEFVEKKKRRVHCNMKNFIEWLNMEKRIVRLKTKMVFHIRMLQAKLSQTPPHGSKIAQMSWSIFGDARRVHVHPSAANGMQNTLFNVSSGDIYVDERAFCGHNVMLITGTHDYRLMGEARHAAPKTGRDIRIGKHVWLCSGVIVLGDVSIGDNAVIAAGSIVTSGTRIPKEQVWAGIPAKFMKNL